MTAQLDALKACEALAAEFTREYFDIDDLPADDDEEERFGAEERERMAADAAALVGEGSSEEEGGMISDVD